jgi:hypothetical protein
VEKQELQSSYHDVPDAARSKYVMSMDITAPFFIAEAGFDQWIEPARDAGLSRRAPGICSRAPLEHTLRAHGGSWKSRQKARLVDRAVAIDDTAARF